MSSSGGEVASGSEDDTWSDLRSAAAEEPTRCLFSDEVLPSAAAALQRAAQAFGFDLARVRKERKLDLYGGIKLVNFVRRQVASAREANPGVLEDAAARQKFVAELQAAVAADKYDDDAFLTPVVEGDPLLFGLELDESEFEDSDSDARGAGGIALAAENEALKLQLLELTAALEDARAGKGTPGASASDGGAAAALAGGEAAPPSPAGMGVDARIVGRTTAEHRRRVDASYFESYSYFDIHRDMLGDVPRTAAYRDALERNPALLRGARVLDVGCGTGILSMFAARAGAAAVVGVDGSERMAAIAAALAADNGLVPPVRAVAGMLEALPADALPAHSFDVLVSEWMGYCLLFESMLDTVLVARDRFLKPGGAMLPDVATMHLAGVSREAANLDFWDDVYGFDYRCVGREVRAESLASRAARVLAVPASAVVTPAVTFKRFDLVTMAAADVEFTTDFTLTPSAASGAVEVHGIVLWFDTEFSARFCSAHPVTLSTSPLAPPTHWAQTLFYFKEPVVLTADAPSGAGGSPGTAKQPAAQVAGRISLVRAARHRSMDVSVEYEPRDGSGVAQPNLRQTVLYEV